MKNIFVKRDQVFAVKFNPALKHVVDFVEFNI